MKPLRYLLQHGGRSPATLANELQVHAKASGELTGSDLRKILDGQRRSPAWLHRSVLELAIAAGWKIESKEDCEIAVRTFRARCPAAKREEFIKAMSTALDNPLPPDLGQAWMQDVLVHPYRDLSGEQFDATVAVMLRDQRITPATVEYARAMLVNGATAAQVAARFGVSHQTVSRAARRIMRTFKGE